MPKFNAFGRLLHVEKSQRGWKVFDIGNEGKRRPAHDVVVPDSVTEQELPQYLGDLLHEHASPAHPDVIRLTH